MDDDVKKNWTGVKTRRVQSERSHQSEMCNVSSSDLNHARFWTAGEHGNTNQNFGEGEFVGDIIWICLFLCFLRRGNIVKAIKTDLECADLRNVFCFGIPLNLMVSFCSH